MQCAKCGHKNSPDFSFCEECGSALSAPLSQVICPDCGHSNPSDFNFCEECACPLQLDQAPAVQETAPPEIKAAAVVCPQCGHANQPDFNFCEECASALQPEVVPAPRQVAEQEAAPAPLPKPEPERKTEPATQPPVRPAPARVGTAAACPHCGFNNPVGLRFCGSCGQPLEEKRSRRKPKFFSRLLRFAVSILVSLIIADISGLATRYAMPYIMGMVANVQSANISQQEAVRQADNFVRSEYDYFLGVSPQVQEARSDGREVYAVGYTRGEGTLVVLVDAVTGSASLLPPDR